MKIPQTRGIKITLLFSLSLIPLLQSTSSFSFKMDIGTQVDPVPFGPSPVQYQEWNGLQNLFSNAVVDELWTAEEFEQAIRDNSVFRRTRINGKEIRHLLGRFKQAFKTFITSKSSCNCIDQDGVLHLIEVEEIDLAHVAELLHNSNKPIMGFKFKNITNKYELECNSNLSITFDLCQFKSFGESNDNSNQSFETIFKRCYFSHAMANRFFFNTALLFIECNLDHAFFDECRFLKKIKFVYCFSSDTTFDKSQFYKIKFTGCDFSRSSFSRCKHKFQPKFTGCNLSDSSFLFSEFHYNPTDLTVALCANFHDCDFSNSSFHGSMFKCKVRFENCEFANCSFSYCTFKQPSEFIGCHLPNSDFNKSKFNWKVNFHNCNLSNSSFEMSDSTVLEATFKTCNLSDSIFDDSTFGTAHFNSCNLSNSSFHGSVFKNTASFYNCGLSNSSFKNNKFEQKVRFDDCDLSKSSFEDSNFERKVRLRDCDLSNSSFSHSKFNYNSIDCLINPHVDFHNCYLSNSSFERSVFEQGLVLNHCLFSKTNFEQTMIKQMDIIGTIPYNANFTRSDIVESLILKNCAVKLTDSGFFHHDFDLFHGAFIENPVELKKCHDLSGNTIAECKIPWFSNFHEEESNIKKEHAFTQLDDLLCRDFEPTPPDSWKVLMCRFCKCTLCPSCADKILVDSPNVPPRSVMCPYCRTIAPLIGFSNCEDFYKSVNKRKPLTNYLYERGIDVKITVHSDIFFECPICCTIAPNFIPLKTESNVSA